MLPSPQGPAEPGRSVLLRSWSLQAITHFPHGQTALCSARLQALSGGVSPSHAVLNCTTTVLRLGPGKSRCLPSQKHLHSFHVPVQSVALSTESERQGVLSRGRREQRVGEGVQQRGDITLHDTNVSLKLLLPPPPVPSSHALAHLPLLESMLLSLARTFDL